MKNERTEKQVAELEAALKKITKLKSASPSQILERRAKIQKMIDRLKAGGP